MRDSSVMRPLVWSSHIHKTPLQILSVTLYIFCTIIISVSLTINKICMFASMRP